MLWKLDDASPDWDKRYDLEDDGVIDILDLSAFMADWLAGE